MEDKFLITLEDHLMIDIMESTLREVGCKRATTTFTVATGLTSLDPSITKST